MKKMKPLTAEAATRIRVKASKMLGREYVKPDADSAAGAAT